MAALALQLFPLATGFAHVSIQHVGARPICGAHVLPKFGIMATLGPALVHGTIGRGISSSLVTSRCREDVVLVAGDEFDMCFRPRSSQVDTHLCRRDSHPWAIHFWPF